MSEETADVAPSPAPPQDGVPNVEFLVYVSGLQEELLQIIDDENSTGKEVKQAKKALKQIAKDIARAAKGDNTDTGDVGVGPLCSTCYPTFCKCTPYNSPACQAAYSNCVMNCHN